MRAPLLAALPLLALCTLAAAPQFPTRPPLGDKLPNGKSRKLEIVKNDHEKSLEDVAAIIALAHELEDEMTRNTEHVLSLESLRKAEEIEDLAKKLRKRMKRIY